MRSSLFALADSPAERSEPPARRLTDPCGKFLPALVYHDLRDRLRGHGERANARWGGIDRPNAPGKLVWVAAGASRDSVRLGVEFARAILARRLDVSLTLTFEQEHPELLAPLATSNRIAWAYAPADYAASMNAVWRRLLPFAIVLAGIAPRPNMRRLCESCRHALLIAPPASISGRYERIYPAHGTVHAGANVAPPADLDVLLVPGRSGSDIGRLVEASPGRGLYLWHGEDVAAAKRLYALFRGHLPEEIMLVSGPACAGLADYVAETLRLSTWNGEPLIPDKLVLVDDPTLLPATAADLRAAHFELPALDTAWQALAAGAVVSAREGARLGAPNARAVLRSAADENALVADWARLAADDALRVAAASASSAAYAAERDLAYATVTELLDRVCAWR
jgi:hypothetical protein